MELLTTRVAEILDPRPQDDLRSSGRHASPRGSKLDLGVTLDPGLSMSEGFAHRGYTNTIRGALSSVRMF